MPSSTSTAPTLSARADHALAGLAPGYFALVMGTGIVSIGLRMAGAEVAALLLLALAVLAAAVLTVLYLARWARHRERMRSDARNPETAFGYFTIVAACSVLAVGLQAEGLGTASVVLLGIILFAAAPVGLVPLAALGGVLMMTAIRMVRRHTAAAILRSTRADAAAFIITALVTVSVDLIFAVIIGIIVAGFFAIRALSRATGVRREEIPGQYIDGDEKIALMRIRGPLFFASSDRILEEVTNQEDVSVVILQMSQLELVDATGAHTLSEIVTRLERRGITVLIKGVLPIHTQLFSRVGVTGALRHENHLFTELGPALIHARSHIDRERKQLIPRSSQ